MKRFKSVVLVLGLVLLMSSMASAAAKKSACIDCHKKVTPGVVQQHLEGKMGKKGIDCSACHGSAHKKMDDAKLAKMPTPETCAGCHSKQADQFKAGKHNLAWIASSSMPMMGHQPKAVAGEGYKGCSSCHKIGAKPDAEKAQIRYGHAQCDSCHTRHSFKKSEAQDPRACQTCHMGFDHPQWEMWSTSKHGTIWQIEGKDSKRAPTCQTCHMSDGDHNVMTSWGFLALRLPEDDKDWMNDRVAILQALGVLDEKGKPTARLDLVKAGKVARLTKEEFQKERDKMTAICAKCHGASYAKKQLDAGGPGGQGRGQDHGRGHPGGAGPVQGRHAQEARGLDHGPGPPPVLRGEEQRGAGPLCHVPGIPDAGLPGRVPHEPGLHALVRLGADEGDAPEDQGRGGEAEGREGNG